MIPRNISEGHIHRAIRSVDKDGVPAGREARGYRLLQNGRSYPPKYVLALANKYANGAPLPANAFSGGAETNDFLTARGFHIVAEEDGDVSVLTVVSSSCHGYSNRPRRGALEEVLDAATERISGALVLVFSGGWFDAGSRPAHALLPWVEQEVAGAIRRTKRTRLVVSVGLDGSDGADQLAVAVTRDGVVACGRKFHPTEGERKRGKIRLAERWDAAEVWRREPYPRSFRLADRGFYLAVCYDIFGIKEGEFTSPDVDAVLEHVHHFEAGSGKGSGFVNFARHGLAGAASRWGRPIFAAATFYDRAVPEGWPSGVAWRGRGASTTTFEYGDNLIEPAAEFVLKTRIGAAHVRSFSL